MVERWVGAGSHVIATKVGAIVAAEAALRLIQRLAPHNVADEHSEALDRDK